MAVQLYRAVSTYRGAQALPKKVLSPGGYISASSTALRNKLQCPCDHGSSCLPKIPFLFPTLELAVAPRKPLLAREIHWCTNQMEQTQTFPNVQHCHNPITVQGLFCIRKMNSFSLNAFSISSYCDISPLQKLSVITCEEGDLYSQDSQLVDPNLISRWGCKMDLIQFQSSSQINLFFFLKKKKPT